MRYRPQIDKSMSSSGNGLTEKANQTLTRSLIKGSKEDPHNWDTQIPRILMGYRATRQASTKHSPFMLLHGHEMALPQPMKRKTVSFDLGEQSEADLRDTFGPLQSTLKTVLDNIGRAQSAQATQYTKRQLHGTVPSKIVQDIVKPPSELVQDTVIPPSKTDVASPQTTVRTVTNNFELDPELDATTIAAAETSPIKIMVEQKDSRTVVDQTSDQTKQASDSKGKTKTRKTQMELQEGDFVLAKVHQMVRKEGDRKGKLVPKAEGHYLISGFTDSNKKMAIIKDATGIPWRVADLSLWE